LFGLLTLFALFFIVPSLIFVVWKFQARAKLRAAISAVPADEPLTMNELSEWYASRGEGDADVTEKWLSALEPFGTIEFLVASKKLPYFQREMTIPPPAEPWAEETDVEALIQSQSEALNTLRTLTREQGTVHYPIPIEEGATSAVELTYLSDATKILALESHIFVRIKRPADAIENVRTQIAMADTLADIPSAVPLLIRLETYFRVFRQVHELVEYNRLNDDELKRLQEMLSSIETKAQFTAGLLGERASVFHDAHQIGWMTAGKTQKGRRIEASRDAKGVTRAEDCAQALVLYTKLVEYSRQDLPAALAGYEEIEGETRVLLATPLDRFRYFIMLRTPATYTFASASGRIAAEQNAAICLIAIERFQLANGKTPSSLNDLVPTFLPAVPKDPFDGRPMRYIEQNGKCTVYSLGENRKDDGGNCTVERGQPLDRGMTLDTSM
jgi:hypothetical protein